MIAAREGHAELWMREQEFDRNQPARSMASELPITTSRVAPSHSQYGSASEAQAILLTPVCGIDTRRRGRSTIDYES